jgi:hypothetical protein
VKVKVKVYVCLTKHYVMKMYWGSGGIAPSILNLGTRYVVVLVVSDDDYDKDNQGRSKLNCASSSLY